MHIDVCAQSFCRRKAQNVEPTQSPGHTTDTTQALRALMMPILESPEKLVDVFAQEVYELKDYESSGIALSEFREVNRRAIEYLIRKLVHFEIPTELVDFPAQLGRMRAQQGVPLSALSRAVRLNFSVLWRDTIVANPPHPDMFVSLTLEFWNTLDRYAEEVQAAYLEEANSRSRNRDWVRGQLFNLLFTSNGSDRDVVRRLATLLELDPGSRFRAVWGLSSLDERMLDLAQKLNRSGLHTFTHEYEGSTVLVTHVTAEQDAKALSMFSTVDCSISPGITGLANVPAAVRTVRAIAAVRPSNYSGAFVLAHAWARMFVTDTGDVGAMFADEVIGPIALLPPAELDLLVRTLREYLSSGSVTGTAAALYCHRNTVINRLNRFTSLTGYDITVPSQAAAVFLALEYRFPHVPEGDGAARAR